MILEKRENNALAGNLTLNGFSLDCVKELKYLGIVLDRLNRVARNSSGLKFNVSSLIYKHGIVPFICYGSQIWSSALKKKINRLLLRKIQQRILLRVISGYRMISYEAVFAISSFPPIDIFIIRNNEFKIATKNCTNKSLDGSEQWLTYGTALSRSGSEGPRDTTERENRRIWYTTVVHRTASAGRSSSCNWYHSDTKNCQKSVI
ncbi:retrovirus-related Pol polyprotein from type-1 retrotransposable element R1 4 [Trichonephila clavipes]|nr:retrovirus-related Pol polyprotein from type-1 retrotransposable element R1 4 [Trichonephila clavipes]